MTLHDPGDGFAAAAEQGRICSLAARGQRDLQQRVAVHPSLFPALPVDGAMLSALALSTAFIAPWCTAGQLRIANLTSLWVTAEDWQVDSVATSADAAAALVAACLDIADGAAPADGDELGRFLAEIRDELSTVAAFPRARPVWREELRRMLTADLREWRWRAAREHDETCLPSFEEYLSNADNYGATWVNVSHWIATGEARTVDRLAELIAASREVQQVLRLVNDLASYERDLKSGDLNALLLGVDRDDVTRQIKLRTAGCRALLDTLAGTCPREAEYLRREIGFTTGFYHGTDFWGSVEH
ncbi:MULTISPECIES: terpene synthase family protein [Micromonospora]|uniref:Terpene synthase n=1 Tax=Micromonospora solifontis TaxID=2487138 RepID=A0ABX9WDC3_9ACTN|nr:MULTISPECIES: terpene synthase family protein [Micromonospora]NES16639.1 terpene synthase [Micromonospora sp. PPF5-17B]NES38173.1 terpene synthase [Micromonospora solifontis]NES56805.1 terpene synthase [Micromonospora sp. PPF5-6]RNL96963.1 terpene synthase [Micromonospora solifontis]